MISQQQALSWLEEVRVLHLNTRYALEEPLFGTFYWLIYVTVLISWLQNGKDGISTSKT